MADQPGNGDTVCGEMARLLAAALIGGVIGAALGLLLAPKAGTDLRSDIKDKAGVAADKAQGFGAKAKEFVDVAKQKIEERRGAGEQAPPEEEAETGEDQAEA